MYIICGKSYNNYHSLESSISMPLLRVAEPPPSKKRLVRDNTAGEVQGALFLKLICNHVQMVIANGMSVYSSHYYSATWIACSINNCRAHVRVCVQYRMTV